MLKVVCSGLKGAKQIAHSVYDFSKDGGANAVAMTLFQLKADSIIHDAWYEVETAPLSAGAATLEVGITGGDTDGIFAQKGKAALTINKVSSNADKGAHLVAGGTDNYSKRYKVTADTDIDLLIGTADLTAGKIHFYLEFSNGY